MPIFNYQCKNCKRKYTVMHKYSKKIENTSDIEEYLKDVCECKCEVVKIISLSFNSTDGDAEKESRDRVSNVMNEIKEDIEDSKRKMKDNNDGK